MDLQDLTHEHFGGVVGTTFRADLDGSVVELQLTQADRAPGEARPDNAFSLLFKGPPDPFLPQGIRELVHDELGSHAIFLVPVGQSEDGYLYEAVFTRLD